MKDRGTYFDTDVKFYQWEVSQLRKVWSIHPTKLDFIKSQRYLKPTESGRKLFHCDCAVCGKPTPLKMIEVNHKVNCGSVKSEGYLERLLNVGFDDLECVCKACHSIITYSERQGITFEEAALEKRVIAFLKMPIKEQKAILGDRPSNNEAVRRTEYRKMLQEEK